MSGSGVSIIPINKVVPYVKDLEYMGSKDRNPVPDTPKGKSMRGGSSTRKSSAKKRASVHRRRRSSAAKKRATRRR